MRLSYAAAVATLAIGVVVATSCGSSTGGGSVKDAGSDAGPCDPRAKPVCPTDCELELTAYCDVDGWACQPLGSCDDATPPCAVGVASCVCCNIPGPGPANPSCQSPYVWACPNDEAGVDAGGDRDGDTATCDDGGFNPPPECYGTDDTKCCVQGGVGAATCVAGQWMCGGAKASGCNGTPCSNDAGGDE